MKCTCGHREKDHENTVNYPRICLFRDCDCREYRPVMDPNTHPHPCGCTMSNTGITRCPLHHKNICICGHTPASHYDGPPSGSCAESDCKCYKYRRELEPHHAAPEPSYLDVAKETYANVLQLLAIGELVEPIERCRSAALISIAESLEAIAREMKGLRPKV